MKRAANGRAALTEQDGELYRIGNLCRRQLHHSSITASFPNSLVGEMVV